MAWPGGGQNIALYALPTAWNFFLVIIYSFPVHSLFSSFFFSKTLSLHFNCVSFDVRNFRVGLRNKECPFQFWQSLKEGARKRGLECVCTGMANGCRRYHLTQHWVKLCVFFYTWYCPIRKSKVCGYYFCSIQGTRRTVRHRTASRGHGQPTAMFSAEPG